MPLLGTLIRRVYELRQLPLDIRSADPVTEQRRVLKRLLRAAQNTAFGETYRFGEFVAGRDFIEEFRKNVPVHDYSSMFKNWWYRSLNGEPFVAWPGRVKYFALTSGTSEASSKHIPVTSDMLRASAVQRHLLPGRPVGNYSPEHPFLVPAFLQAGPPDLARTGVVGEAE